MFQQPKNSSYIRSRELKRGDFVLIEPDKWAEVISVSAVREPAFLQGAPGPNSLQPGGLRVRIETDEGESVLLLHPSCPVTVDKLES